MPFSEGKKTLLLEVEKEVKAVVCSIVYSLKYLDDMRLIFWQLLTFITGFFIHI